ncbi:hypothetical protein [Chryseobacterium jejuense]|uniref:Aspartyl protease n=1 Tax=Chryseobacterium jejuense TaxID=445960 RepID=A0A2X2X1V6_CHRJE|nr:hypothetical protein [Chryseobacterium jejuense]SDI24017.1 hypothetical protein SAMN05421542_0543 [Chryseobacterium jejuense]SQB46808.1 Uncharacterised protein [Chryseobacterium jejuense]
MKSCLSLLLVSFLASFSWAQNKLPILKANGPKAIIYEKDNGLKTDWNIDPKIKPDVYTTSKIAASNKRVTIKTDIDSLVVDLKKGEKKDFIILLKGKDSALTRIESLPPKDFSKMSFKDTMKLHINEQNTIFIKTVLNKVDTLLLNFDTGTSDLVLTQETLKNKIKSSLKSGTNILQIGKKEYKGFTIYPAQLTGHGTDGRFGWDLFDGMIVEVNHDKGLMVVHSQLPSNVKSQYSPVPIKYFNNVFLVQVGISQDKIKNKDWYLFDTGYQRTAMLDGPLLNEQGFPTDKMTVIKKVIMKGAQGNEIPVMTSNLQTLSLGKTKLKDIPAQILSQSRPVTGSRMNILGNEIIKRFNLFLDFQNNIVYLKPNKLVDADYIERK